jgi:hypothetical protein
VQPMSDASSYDPSVGGYRATEDNRPLGWSALIWTEAPTPSGHATVTLYFADVVDVPDGVNDCSAARVL